MVLVISATAVKALDFLCLGISAAVFLASAFASLYTVRYSRPSVLQENPAVHEFNLLWRARVLSQILASLLALSQILRLQIMWGYNSVLKEGGIYPALFCRLFTAITYGVLEPAYLLVALFSCMYSLQGGKSGSSNPSTRIVLLALVFCIPFSAAQLVCALFTRLFSLSYSSIGLSLTFFSTFDTRQTDFCHHQEAGSFESPTTQHTQLQEFRPSQVNSNCAICTFALLSTLISAFFATALLLVAWYVTERVARRAVNKALIFRIRLLQLLVVLFLPLSIVCRGLTVLFQPFQLGFELLRLGNVMCVAGMVISISLILVVKPVYDSYKTDQSLQAFFLSGTQPGWPRLPFAKENIASAQSEQENKGDRPVSHVARMSSMQYKYPADFQETFPK